MLICVSIPFEMKCIAKEISLPFRYPFRISKGLKTEQPSLIVQLQYMGKTGYGEAPAITYYQVTTNQMMEELQRKLPVLEKFAFTGPERFWHFLHHLFPNNPFLVCALDMAGWDLFGQLRRTSLLEYWKLNPEDAPVTDYTIGIDEPAVMLQKMKEKPWPVYKVKVGFPGDIECVELLRNSTDARIRVDANAAWSLDEAIPKIKALHQLQVEFVEQPLAKDNWEGMEILYKESPIPIIADESCVFKEDVKRCLHHFHGINIKLTKCSGITPALEMVREARELGLNVMVGCMNESSIGTAAIAQIAPLLDYVDMDGPLLLQKDTAAGVQFDYGKIQYQQGFGLCLRDVCFE